MLQAVHWSFRALPEMGKSQSSLLHNECQAETLLQDAREQPAYEI
jgi:hypothetical protein